MKSDIRCNTTSRRMRLGTCIKAQKAKTQEIFWYLFFPAGDIPKVLVKKDDRILKCLSTATDHQHTYSAIKAAQASRTCSLIWILKFDPDKNRLQPYGLSVVSNKSLTVPGCGELNIRQQG